MAIMQFGGLVGAASGRIGGVTFARCKSGPIVRANTRPSPHAQKKLLVRRALFQKLTQMWQGASDGEREAWNAYAADPGHTVTNRLGVSVYITGYQWFKRFASERQSVGFVVDMAVPVYGAATAPVITGFTFVHSAPGVYAAVVTFSGTEFVGYRGLMKGAYSMSAGVGRNYNAIRIISWASPAAGTSWNFTTALVAAYGVPIDGARYTVELRKTRETGLMSAPAVATAIVTKTY